MKLKEAIVMYRAKANISMRQFADRCGVTMQTIYNIESVGQKPSRVTRAKIMLVLGDQYDVDDVEEEDEE